MRTYFTHGKAGLVSRKPNRETGTVISVWNNRQAKIESTEEWSLRCEEHGVTVPIVKYAIAMQLATHPLKWCGQCMAEAEAIKNS